MKVLRDNDYLKYVENFQQLVIDHKKITHKTYADIAKEMGCSVRTLRRKLHNVSELKVMDALKLIQILDIKLGEGEQWIEKS